MNIIFGDSIHTIGENYTILELDTFRKTGQDVTVTAYCVVEKPALNEFANMESYKKIHEDVIRHYKQRQWNYCEQALQGLMGRWGGELDTFYANLLDRVMTFKQAEPPEEWDGILLKD